MISVDTPKNVCRGIWGKFI